MGKERFMRHYYGPSGYVSPEERKRLETEESSQRTTILGFLVREMARLTRIANKSDYDEGYYDALVAVEKQFHLGARRADQKWTEGEGD